MRQSQIASRGETETHLTRFDRWLALGGLVGPFVFVLAFTVAGVLRPGYSPVHQTVSDLGIGSNHWLVNASLVFLGMSLIGFAMSFYRAVRPPASSRLRVTTAALHAGVGIAFVAAAVFPETDRLHYAAALLFFVSAPLALLLAGLLLRRDPESRGWATLTLAMSVTTFVLVILTVYTFSFYRPTSGPEMVGQFGGLMERMVFIVTLAWYGGSGWRMFRDRSRRSPDLGSARSR